jgi:hypothetical protein
MSERWYDASHRCQRVSARSSHFLLSTVFWTIRRSLHTVVSRFPPLEASVLVLTAHIEDDRVPRNSISYLHSH